MYYDYFQSVKGNYDVTRGGYLVSPSASSLQEIILLYLKELSYYILELKEMGAENEVIKEHIIEAISGIASNVDYNQEQFRYLVGFLHQDLSQTKAVYSAVCSQNNVKSEFLKNPFKLGKEFNINEIIKKGEQYYILKNSSIDSEQKNIFDIMLYLIKNICLKIIQIKPYGESIESGYNAILSLLNSMNVEMESSKDLKEMLNEGIIEYNSLVLRLSDIQEKAHGKRHSVCIPFAPRNGKAILVSGIDLKQLEAVLEATKNEKIDVYTHGLTMIMAHTLEKFRSAPNLVGHFGVGCENSLFDFASFPGAILMTRYLFQRADYLYKGRVFTTDKYAPRGVVKIVDNNYDPLIKAALEAKGFTKEQQQIIKRVGFRQKVMEEKIQYVVDKMRTNEIRHLYFIGILNEESEYKEYFEEFFKNMPKDCYAVSLSYEKSEENVLRVDSFYDYLFIYKLLDKLSQARPLKEIDMTIFITKCDQYTITNIMNFKRLGVKNIFLCDCLPAVISPSILEALGELFYVKKFSEPAKDLEITLSKEN